MMMLSRIQTRILLSASALLPHLISAENAFTERFANTTLIIESPPAAESATPGANPVPQFLSQNPTLLQAGLGYVDDVVPKGLFPYKTHSQLWTDGARKERFFATPGVQPLTYTAVDAWLFPTGSITIKNFIIPIDARTPDSTLQRVETRIFVKFATGWQGYSYRWNEAQTDAELLPSFGDAREFNVIDSAGQPATYVWNYPARGQCFACHDRDANVVLGITTTQLNWDYTFPHNSVTQNHLTAFQSIGLFDSELPGPPETLPSRPNHLDQTAPLEARLHSYIATNCGICHRPMGSSGVQNMDFRWETPPALWNALYVPMNKQYPSLSLTSRLQPGNPDASGMVRLTEVGLMPCIGVTVPDPDGVALLREYVQTLQAEQANNLWIMN